MNKLLTIVNDILYSLSKLNVIQFGLRSTLNLRLVVVSGERASTRLEPVTKWFLIYCICRRVGLIQGHSLTFCKLADECCKDQKNIKGIGKI